jgi:hypothetical protein
LLGLHFSRNFEEESCRRVLEGKGHVSHDDALKKATEIDGGND